ncbi:unnamed protein product [Rhizophagus irregularis]|nr:unnamed protein product [Rhizophagus irregularis]
MSEYVNHKYFDRTYSEWSIIGFLNECTIEPLRNKIGQYLTSLENIINTEKGRRRDKAQQLYNQYKMDTRPDRALARKWDSDRSHNQFHIHQPTFTNGGTNNVNISGLVEGGNIQRRIKQHVTKQSVSDHNPKRQNENDYEEELPSTPPNKIRATTRTLRETSPTSLLYDEDTSSSDSEIRPTLLINVFQDQQQKPVAKQSEQSGSVPIPKIVRNKPKYIQHDLAQELLAELRLCPLKGFKWLWESVDIRNSFKDKHTRTPLNIGVVNFHDNSCTKPLPSSMITHIQNQMENEEDSTIFFDDNKKFGIDKFEIDVDEDVIGFLDEFWNCMHCVKSCTKNSVHNRPNFNFDINYAYQFFNHMYNLYSNDMLAQTLTESEYTAYVWTPLLHYAFMDKGEIRISSGEVSSTAYEKLKKLAQIQEKSGPRMDSSAVILSIGQEVLIQENGSAYLALPTVSRPEIHKFEVYMIQTNELSLSLYVASYVFENTICMFGLTDITIPRTIEAFPKCVEAVFKVLSWKARTRKNTKIFHELIGKSASQHHEKKYFSPKKIANQAKP